MNDKEILEESNNTLESSNDDTFFSSINSTLNVKKNYESMQFDYSWIDKFFEVLPYIDNILRNPKKFIVNTEEILKVEQARKTGVESVIHLTQHTNLIRSIEDNGDVIPSKILTINREESLDTYENRFIYTLIGNMQQFYNDRVSGGLGNSYYVDDKNLSYLANTRIGSEKIQIDLKIKSLDKSETVVDKKGDMSISDKLKKIKTQVDSFTASDLYKTLAKSHVAKVRSPIRKTNVILKNPNFQQANILWNFIQSYEVKDVKVHDKKEYFDKGQIKNSYDNAFLMLYTTNKILNNIDGEGSFDTILVDMIDRLVENILDTNPDVDEEILKDKFNREILKIKRENTVKRNSVRRIFNEKFDVENNHINNLLQLLEEK